MERIEVLEQIDFLFREREKADRSEKKLIDKKIQALGQQLRLPKKEKRIKEIIAKGSDMTISEMKYLHSNEYSYREMAEIMGVTLAQFKKYVKRLQRNGIYLK